MTNLATPFDANNFGGEDETADADAGPGKAVSETEKGVDGEAGREGSEE